MFVSKKSCLECSVIRQKAVQSKKLTTINKEAQPTENKAVARRGGKGEDEKEEEEKATRRAARPY